MWLMPGSLLASIEAPLFSLGADDDGISIGGRAGRATDKQRQDVKQSRRRMRLFAHDAREESPLLL